MRAAQRDRSAFEALLALHERTLVAVARAHVSGPGPAQRASEVEEVLQEAALRTWRDIVRLERPERFLNWACSIVQHVANDRARRAGLRQVAGIEQLAEHAQEAGGPSETTRLRLLAAIERLPGPMREVIELFYFAELGYREIAEVRATSVSTVNLRLAEARSALRRALEHEHE